MNRQKIISIENGNSRQPEYRMDSSVTLDIYDEPTAIVGPNGAGKTRLVNLLAGVYPLAEGTPRYDFSPRLSQKACDNIRYVAFCDTSGESNLPAYYQQRWNRGDCDDTLPTVADFLQYSKDTHDERLDILYDALNIPSLLNKQIIMLSSGELRRIQLLKAIHSFPRLLIIDNPYIGLDSEARTQITQLLEELALHHSITPVLVVSKMEDIPPFISTIIRVENKRILSAGSEPAETSRPTRPGLTEKEVQTIQTLAAQTPRISDDIVRFNDISIRYGKRTIIDHFSWNIANGEKWALSGPNGAGKSTLLSLICADNPQAYACDIALFGHQRGSGESIWDIKKNIGYVSPEIFRSYRKDTPAINIITSGLRDTIGLYRRSTPAEAEQCALWIRLFGLEALCNTSYINLSSGEQRLVLLARAFVKNPALLILDEPFHGLDAYNCIRARQIIDTFCSQPNKTLIMVSHYDDEYPSCITRKLTLTKHREA